VKLSGPSCGAKYSIADEKVQDRLAKIRCRKCSATIIVDGKVDPPNVYTSESGSVSQSAPLDTGEAGGPAPGEYSVDFGDNDQRTMTADDIVQAYRRGQLTADTYVWTEGMADWQPVGSVPELAEALTAAAPAPPAPAAAPAAVPRAAAARTGSGRGSATDLFGGIDKAGSEEDVMTSAPQPAAAAAPALATGARNESSVLFSLSALTASGPIGGGTSSRSASSASDSKGEDSGLIDLKALTSAAGSLPPPNPLALGAAPLGMAAPLGGMTAPALAVDNPIQRGGGSKTGLYIGGALVVVGALIAGAIVMTAGKGGEGPSAAAPVATAAPPPAAPEPEPKKEEPTAQPPATGTAEASKEAPKETPTKQASTKTTVHSKPKTSTPAPEKEKPVVEKPSAPTASEPTEKPKKPAPKKEKTCNCGPGDLMCAMKCAAS
jgi:hypothetical protein